MNLKGRSFLTLKDFTPEEIMYMVDLAAELKAKKKQSRRFPAKNRGTRYRQTSCQAHARYPPRSPCTQAVYPYMVDLAAELKAKKKQGITGNSLKGKNIALIFEKPSTRTRCSFTIGCIDEGGHPEYLGREDIQLGYKESVEDRTRRDNILPRLFPIPCHYL